jgi:hypothetical protein
MRRTLPRQALARLLSVLAALAMIAALFGVAAAKPADAITISDLTPADGSTVPAGQQVQVSGFITTDSAIATVNNQPDVSVFIDGTQTQAQFVVGSGAVRVGFQTNQVFTTGSHTLRVTARNVAGETTEAQSTFTAVQGATPTAAAATPTTAAVATATTVPAATPTTAAVATATTVLVATPSAVATATPTTPAQLPVTGGAPGGVAPMLVLALGSVAIGIGLRRRHR